MRAHIAYRGGMGPFNLQARRSPGMAGRTIWSGEARSAEFAGRRGAVTDGRVGRRRQNDAGCERRTGHNEREVNTSKK